jgi:glycosyltransferase involved in cell wall biosynthesis
MPQVSVIIPAYNAERTLERAVNSCLLQEGVTYEIIIVDNNSTDGTLLVADRLAVAYSMITVSQETRQGAAAARNHGARLARGEWLQFLDADDVLLEGKWLRQMKLVSQEKNWVIGAFLDEAHDGSQVYVGVEEDPWYGLLVSGGIGCMHSNIFRRSLSTSYGGMDEEWSDHEDYEWYTRLLCGAEPYSVDHDAGSVYFHPDLITLSKVDPVGYARRRVALTEVIITYLKQELYEYYEKRQKMINSSLLKHLRQQATVDFKTAVANEKRLVKVKYIMSNYERIIGRSLIRSYYWLGFERVERIRLLGAAVFPSQLKVMLRRIIKL